MRWCVCFLLCCCSIVAIVVVAVIAVDCGGCGDCGRWSLVCGSKTIIGKIDKDE